VKFFWMALLAVGGIAFGLWLTDTITMLTQVEGTKLLLARIVIWGGIAMVLALWLARRPIVVALISWAEQTERAQTAPLIREAGAGRLERLLGGCFVIACGSLTLLAFVAPTIFIHQFREDGPFEIGSAIFYFAAAFACVLLATRADGHRFLRLWLGLLALLFVFVGGEEISWGQRMFGFATPEKLEVVNVQGEFTLHNVYSNSLFVYPGLAVTALLLFVAPLLRARSKRARQFLDAFEFPTAPPSCAWLYGLAVIAYALVGLRLGTPTPLPINWSNHLPNFDDELLEFPIALLFATYALSHWRLLTPRTQERVVAQGQPLLRP